jgi:hypothetical protein
MKRRNGNKGKHVAVGLKNVFLPLRRCNAL